MTDLTKLKALAEAIHGKGTTVEMLNRWAAFESACKPELITGLIAENEANRHEREVVCTNYDQLKSECEGLRKDAERYRWLRDKAAPSTWEYISHQDPSVIDADVDQAMTSF